MPYGFWSKAGLRWRWPRGWDNAHTIGRWVAVFGEDGPAASRMPVICGGECTGRRHPGSGNDGMPYGFWSKAGLRWRWPRGWDGMPIPLAGGLPSSVRTVRRRWPSSSRGVPPRDRRSAADRTEGSGAGGSSKGWPRLGQLELEEVVRRFVQERCEVSLSPNPPKGCSEAGLTRDERRGKGSVRL